MACATTNENRGSVFSAYVLINMTMLAVGQQMMLLDDPTLMTLFAMSSVLVSLAAVPVSLSTAPTPRQVQEGVKLDVPYLYRTSPAGMLGSLATGLANGSFWALAPVFTISYSTDVSLTAWFMSAAVIGGAASQWPLGAWSDRIDRRYVMAFCAALSVDVASVLGRAEDLPRAEHRQTVMESTSGFTVVDDTFNSNPAGARLGRDVALPSPRGLPAVPRQPPPSLLPCANPTGRVRLPLPGHLLQP